MNTPLKAIGLACLLVVSLTACSDKPSDTKISINTGKHGSEGAKASAGTATTSAPRNAAKPAAPSDELSQLADKLGGYVKCFNRLDENTHNTITRYTSWVKDMKAGPTGKERVVYGLNALNEKMATECADKFDALSNTAPKLPAVDQTATAYAKALVAMAPLVNKANTYYDRQNYKDDGFAQARAMHADLAAQFDAFTKASTAFSAALETANNAMQRERLKKVEAEEGKSLNYWTLLQSVRAREMVDILLKDDFSLDQANQAHAAFEEAVDARNEALKSNPKGSGDIANQIPRAAEDLSKSAKRLIRRVRDKTPYSYGERMQLANGSSGWAVEGSPARVLRDYNQFVQANNRGF